MLASTDPGSPGSGTCGACGVPWSRWSRAGRSGEAVAVAVADIDGRKSVNDVYGHDVGDEVIRHVAMQLTTHVGDLGVAARSGGEEFTIALIHPSVDTLCESVRTIPTRLVRWTGRPDQDAEGRCHVRRPRHRHHPGETPRARPTPGGQVMYEQKRSGGNGVRVRR